MEHHSLKVSILEAVTQADLVICYEAVNGSCDAAIADDERQPMHPNYTIDSVKPPKYWGKPDDGKLLCEEG